MKIYLIRHTSVDVPQGYTYGQTDVPLRPTFEEEAAVVKENIQSHVFDKVYTSPLSRCVRLATFCGYPEAERIDDLKEINFGEWEMKSWDDLAEDPRSKAWFDDWVNIAAPQGESMNDLYHRVAAFLEKLKASNLQKVCLFAHGGVLTCARIYAGHYAIKDAFNHMPPYGSIIQITLRNS